MRQPIKTLIVDDSRVVRAYFEKTLLDSQPPENVTSVETGTAALKALGETSYDLVLLDLQLPDMDGLDVLRAIRQSNQESAVMIVTAHSGVQSAIEAGQQGADGYAEKEELIRMGQSADELWHRIDQSMAIRAGRRASAELERIRSELYAMVSHDLRNPINIIQLASSLLSERFGRTDTEGQNLVEMIQNNTQNLLQQLDDFLDFARLESGAINLRREDLDLVALCDALVEEMRLLAENRGHVLELKSSVDTLHAHLDRRRIRQLLSNYIENAIKYSPDPGTITLGLMAQDASVILMVSDTGIGVPEGQRDQLFRAYMRASNAESSRIKGTGLGLLIVRQIAEAHGGRVWYRARPDGGSIFGVTLPQAVA